MSDPSAVDAEIGFRAGGRVLSILKNPLNTTVLRAHVNGPKRLVELQEEIRSAPATTLRAAVSGLCDAGALVKPPAGASGYGTTTTLSPVGEEILRVADEVEAWLALCPKGPIAPDSEGAKVALKALAGAWDSTLMRALATRPLTLNELSRLIPQVSYPSLERRISWMRKTGQVEAMEKTVNGTPYKATDWLRHAVAPICVAGRCERRHMEGESARATSVEVETAFLLAVRLITLGEGAHGRCTFAVQIGGEDDGGTDRPPVAGASVKVMRGEIVSCAPGAGAEPSSWAVGTSTSWLDAVIDGNIEALRIGGTNPQLVLDLIGGLHFALFDRH